MSEVVLSCRECHLIFTIINPSLDLIEWPICPSCRIDQNDDDTQENS